MTIDRKQMKAEARLAMRRHRPSIYLMAMIYAVILYVLSSLSLRLQLPGITADQLWAISAGTLSEEELLRIASQIGTPGVAATLLRVAINLMEMVLAAGFSIVCLNVARRLPAAAGTLFDGFGIFFRVIWLEIVMAVFVLLWSLLLIVPGIIAGYRYRFALYILIDDPTKGALQCIRESKELTYGHKGELFVLDLSFLGWSLLSAIPFVSIYTRPYMTLTDVNYYRVVLGENGIADGPAGGESFN